MDFCVAKLLARLCLTDTLGRGQSPRRVPFRIELFELHLARRNVLRLVRDVQRINRRRAHPLTQVMNDIAGTDEKEREEHPLDDADLRERHDPFRTSSPTSPIRRNFW